MTPHHLALTDETVRTYDTNFKMAPPLRSARDREALREGLADGTIDCIATDHAPHALYEKDVEFTAAPFGVVGFETALPVGLELVREERMTPLELVDRLSTRPARVLGVGGGTLEAGGPADLVLVDPERIWKVELPRLTSRSKNSAFLGRELHGRSLRTWVGGRLVSALGEGDLA